MASINLEHLREERGLSMPPPGANVSEERQEGLRHKTSIFPPKVFQSVLFCRTILKTKAFAVETRNRNNRRTHYFFIRLAL